MNLMVAVPLHAVVAGDVVGSSELATDIRRQLPDLLDETHDEVAEKFGRLLPDNLAISAGDEWRMYVDDPAAALAASLAYWTRLKSRGIVCRMVLAVDTIDFIDDGNLHRSDGAAFRQAGRGLQLLTDPASFETHFNMLLPGNNNETAELCGEAITDLVEMLLTDLTEAQAQAIAEKLTDGARGEATTTADIAGRWQPEPISRQAVSKHLNRGNWPRLQRTIRRFEQLIQNLSAN